MDQVVTFVTAHWQLSLLFVVIVICLIIVEMRERISGVPRLSSSQLTQLLNHADGIILDIRAKDAFAKGHILGASHASVDDLEKRVAQLKLDKQKPVIVVCENGLTSHKTAATLRKLGFEKANSLKGGMMTWRNDGLPVVK